jgi:hypothetical protein
MRERADAYRPHMCAHLRYVARDRGGFSAQSCCRCGHHRDPLAGKPGVAGLGPAGWTMIVALHSQVGGPPNIGKGAGSYSPRRTAGRRGDRAGAAGTGGAGGAAASRCGSCRSGRNPLATGLRPAASVTSQTWTRTSHPTPARATQTSPAQPSPAQHSSAQTSPAPASTSALGRCTAPRQRGAKRPTGLCRRRPTGLCRRRPGRSVRWSGCPARSR